MRSDVKSIVLWLRKNNVPVTFYADEIVFRNKKIRIIRSGKYKFEIVINGISMKMRGITAVKHFLAQSCFNNLNDLKIPKIDNKLIMINLLIPASLFSRIKTYAEKNCISVSEAIRELLIRGILRVFQSK